MNYMNQFETIKLSEIRKQTDSVAIITTCVYPASVLHKCCKVEVYTKQHN